MAKRGFKIRWTYEAAELESIFKYIHRDSPFYAKRVTQEIVDAIRKIRRKPTTGRVVPEFELGGIRELRVYNFRVVYELRDDSAEILGVIHAMRDFHSVMKQRFRA